MPTLTAKSYYTMIDQLLGGDFARGMRTLPRDATVGSFATGMRALSKA